jgi:hypothetical protein
MEETRAYRRMPMMSLEWELTIRVAAALNRVLGSKPPAGDPPD